LNDTSKPLSRAVENILPVNPILGRDRGRPLAERMALYNCPGISICLISDGEIVDAAGYGVVEVGGAPVEVQTMFAGASISKPVAAVLAMQLVEQGLIDLDGPINNHLKRWRLPDNDFTRATPVTLRHLLCHKAGTTVHGFGNYPTDLPAPTLLDILNGALPSPTPAVLVDKAPGGSVRYSGGGTQIVQLMLEDQTGLAFADLARTRIFEPLGMASTTFEQPLPARFQPLAAVGHDGSGAPIASRQTFTPQQAAGGIYTTATDYARFMIECRKGWLGLPNKVLGQAASRAMMTRQDPGQFGLGWEVFGDGETARFSHGGSNEGFQCTSSLSLDTGNGAVILTNSLLGIILHAEVLNSLAETFDWEGLKRPWKRVVEISQAEKDRLVGRYDIVSGVSAPYIDIWREDDQLFSRTEGFIFPPRAIFLGENGRFFGQQTPAETQVRYGQDGLAEELTAFGEGEVEILRAVRRAGEEVAA
jgi:CubicO group peptidase (beta-lactamase class C family)